MDGSPERLDAAAVVGFLAGRDAPCPWCDYNLRDAVEARCPECGRVVQLTNLRWSDRRTRRALAPPLAVTAASLVALLAAVALPPMFFIRVPITCGWPLLFGLFLGLGVLFLPWTFLPPRLTRNPEGEVRAFANVLWIYAWVAVVGAAIVGVPALWVSLLW